MTFKRGMVWLTWPIFARATVVVDLERFCHGIPLTAINNVVDDGPLFLSPTAIHIAILHRQYCIVLYRLSERPYLASTT